MTDSTASPTEASLIAAVEPLRAIGADDRVAASPSRVPMSDGRECLVLWRPNSTNGDWSLVLYARSPNPAEHRALVARLAVHLPAGNKSPAVFWEDADPEFRQWADANLPEIAREIAHEQPQQLAVVRQRAGLSDSLAKKFGEIIPHLVVLGGLAGFAYMFGIVHIK